MIRSLIRKLKVMVSWFVLGIYSLFPVAETIEWRVRA